MRPQLESGKSRNTGEPCGEGLLKKNWPELLDAHYQCQVPGPSACLQDALHMITTGKVRITCPGAKKEEGKEARTLSEPSGSLREAFGKPEKVSTSLKEKMTVEREHAIRASPINRSTSMGQEQSQ